MRTWQREWSNGSDFDWQMFNFPPPAARDNYFPHTDTDKKGMDFEFITWGQNGTVCLFCSIGNLTGLSKNKPLKKRKLEGPCVRSEGNTRRTSTVPISCVEGGLYLPDAKNNLVGTRNRVHKSFGARLRRSWQPSPGSEQQNSQPVLWLSMNQLAQFDYESWSTPNSGR